MIDVVDTSAILSLDNTIVLRARYLRMLHKARQALLMQLAEVENQLIEAGELQRRTVAPQRQRRAARYQQHD